jgi:hypothetical protein
VTGATGTGSSVSHCGELADLLTACTYAGTGWPAGRFGGLGAVGLPLYVVSTDFGVRRQLN